MIGLAVCPVGHVGRVRLPDAASHWSWLVSAVIGRCPGRT